MNMYNRNICIFLKDSFERWEFIKYIKKELLPDIIDKRMDSLYKYINSWIYGGYSFCYLSLNENFIFTLDIIPATNVMHSGLGTEYLLVSCGRKYLDMHAISFELAKKELSKIVQCGTIL